MMYDMLHADSRCLTLLAKAIVKVQGCKSSKEVQSEADALEAYEVLDDEDLPISLVVQPPKDKHLQVKQLLTFIGPTAATAKTGVNPRSYNQLSVDGLSDYVIDCVKKIEFNHFKSLSMYMNLADALQALMHNLQHYEESVLVPKKNVILLFMSALVSPKNQSAIRSWFSEQDITLSADDFTSMRYWQQSLDASDGVSHFNEMSMDCDVDSSSQNSDSEE
ncbi:hypothetical protein HK100_010003 [Physocladia obscura]|uniref:Uncharacterized protein n=1 Tax=Physocladia obscura TaxID=109957 RepID=A0AAD5T5J2_9FUNG|nr:hypothetical protein HK100_010003 [Physocladia obscura]